MRRRIAVAVVALTLIASPAGAVPLVPSMLNPAVTQATIRTTICVAGWSKSQRRVTAATKRAVFVAAGIPRADRHLYVVDHIVALEVGGSNARSNLAVQTITNSRTKDVVENYLHRAVCTGRTPLVDAQRRLASAA